MTFIRMIALLLLTTPPALADRGDLYTGAREAAMGGASTAITEGDEAIYLNPAAMAGNKGVDIYLMNADGQVSTQSISTIQSSTTYFKNISPSTINNFMNQDLAAQGTLSPAITFPHFGVSLFIDQQFALLVQNQANPQVLLGLQTTNGVQFAGGFSLLPQRKSSKDDLRIGFGYKFMFRRGGYYTLTQDQIFNLSEASVKGIVGNFSEGSSGDFGVQYIHTVNNKLKLLAGLDWAQIGNMSFNNGGQTQDQNLSLGIGTKIALSSGMGLTVGYDVKHLTDDMEWAKRNHFGVDFSLLNLDFFGGLNDGYYLTGGASIDLWLLKLTALTYEQEIDAFAGQLGERLYMLRITFKLPI